MPTASPLSRRWLWWLIGGTCVLLLIGLVLVLALVRYAEPTFAGPPVRLTMAELRRIEAGPGDLDWELHTKRFNTELQHRILEVTGEVKRITRHADGTVSAQIDGRHPDDRKWPILGYEWRFPETTRLEYGQTVTVRCRCYGLDQTPTYRDFELVSVSPSDPAP